MGQMNIGVNRSREGVSKEIMNMLTDPLYANFASFACVRSSDDTSGSLEGIHNLYHFLLGGEQNHMAAIAVAGKCLICLT